MMRGNNNSSRPLLGIQSLVLVLQVCAFMCLSNEHEGILVESWSPKVLPFSTNHRHTAIHFPRTRFPVISAASSDDDDGGDENDDEPQFIEVESLSANQVMELIELSFFQACFALSKGDIEQLKLFIVAVTTASKKYKGASAKALTIIVDDLPPSLRALEPQERDLRETWIRAVYLMMGHVLEGFDSGGYDDDDDEVAKTYGPILVDLVAIHRTGMGLNVDQFVASRKDILLPKDNVLVLDVPEDDDLMQLAVVTQTINVLFTTLVVLEEEDDDNDSIDGSTGQEEKSPSESSLPTSSAKNKSKGKGKKSSSSGKGFG